MKRLTFNKLDNIIISQTKNLNRDLSLANKCHIHDYVLDREINQIHKDVCINDLPLIPHDDGRKYCFFHYPTNVKNPTIFKEKFNEKVSLVEQSIKKISEFPKEKQEQLKQEFFFDFRYVWFPIEVVFTGYTFAVDCNFKMATFSKFAFFDEAHFLEESYFTSTTFVVGAFFGHSNFAKSSYFNNAKFLTHSKSSACVSYISANFSSMAVFSGTLFSGKVGFELSNFENVDFNGAIFTEYTNFSNCIFKSEASFNETNFLENVSFSRVSFDEFAQISFLATLFLNEVTFSKALIKGYLYSEAGEGHFYYKLKDQDEETLKVSKRFTNIFESSLDFFHVRAINPERITFNKVRLRPSWFLHTDLRKFIFTDVQWENDKGSREDINAELMDLFSKNYKKPHSYKLLTISYRYLAHNAEEFNRFEEASKFRRIAFETERLERKEKISKWWSEKYSCSEVVPSFWDHLKLLPYDFLNFAYRFSSYYGESSVRAFIVLTGIILIATFLYWIPLSQFPYKDTFRSLDFIESIFYSLRVMVLQRPEPFPANTFGKAVLALESVLAPVQLALLALAIRRKFMR